jgi:L-alanine-DL-glutamate epimerase-like enolase superfamily enzyme
MPRHGRYRSLRLRVGAVMVPIDATEAERRDAAMLAFHTETTPGYAVRLLRVIRAVKDECGEDADVVIDAEDLLEISGVS